ncbi:MAG: putative anti-sigma regulatory factor, serine/threonine protein kinase [Chitinophagaceae bacterium]|nr:putative anti-sigma regulatory factor, serine/threonine protein kinase [Chitinophagaceae bacterium]
MADRSYFALLKKDIRTIAVEAGFSETKVGEVDIIVAEIVTNLVKHGGGGNLLVKRITQAETEGIELIAIDNGAGIAELNKMMADGVSTTNTLGQGLGAIQRLSDVFQVYTQKEWGTILLCRVFSTPLPMQKKPMEVRSLVVAKAGETECGDAFCCVSDKGGARFFLGDGLGHGKEAAIAVHAATDAFLTCKETSAAETIRNLHLHVKKTRGLVGAVANYQEKRSGWNVCGVGNISIRFINGIEQRTLMSYNGIIGYNIPTSLKDHEVVADEIQLLIMCSDGIRTKWDLWKYPGILKYDLSIVAAVLFKDFARNTDDMSIVIVRINH